jgi:hypothetical protein
MRSHPAPLRSVVISGRALAKLVALAVALVAAFVVAPRTLAASGSGGGFVEERNVIEAIRGAFVEYWASGDIGFPPGLERVVDYWFRYHVAKAVIAAILLVVLSALGVLLCRAFLRAAGIGLGRRVALASACAVVSVLVLFSLLVVMANIQGAVAPFASLVPMLAVGPMDAELANTLDQVRQRLADFSSAGHQNPPALEVMVSEFSQFHVALVVLAAIVAVVFVGMSVVLWKGFARTGSSEVRTRFLLGSFGVLLGLFLVVVTVLAVANATTAQDPAPALLAFFEGGW